MNGESGKRFKDRPACRRIQDRCLRTRQPGVGYEGASRRVTTSQVEAR